MEPGTNPDGATGSACSMARQDCRYRLRMVLDHQRTSLPRAIQAILKIARKSGYSEDQRADLEIALTEALANALIHGNEQGAGKTIFLRCYAAPRQGLMIVVRDQGQGFDSDHVPDPRDDDRKHLHHGRGVFLMRQLMDACIYRRSGTEVVLFKSLTA